LQHERIFERVRLRSPQQAKRIFIGAVLKGQGFIRAVNEQKINWALAPEGKTQTDGKTSLSG
jgi:hypothetical protein